jgi:hypothetical protein
MLFYERSYGRSKMTAPPSSLSLLGPYFDAWNARDPDAVAAAFAEGGTYTDPTVSGPALTGTAIAGHARALLATFPDELSDPRRPGR